MHQTHWISTIPKVPPILSHISQIFCPMLRLFTKHPVPLSPEHYFWAYHGRVPLSNWYLRHFDLPSYLPKNMLTVLWHVLRSQGFKHSSSGPAWWILAPHTTPNTAELDTTAILEIMSKLVADFYLDPPVIPVNAQEVLWATLLYHLTRYMPIYYRPIF